MDLPDIETVKATGVTMQMPFRIGISAADLWTLPYEPLVSVRSANLIVRRAIAKRAGIGSVKELWTQDDYQIGVIGILIADDPTRMPEEDITKLNNLLKGRTPLVVQCRLFDLLGISLMAVEQWEFPPTPGLFNQAYQFSGYSDYPFELY